jgi:ornithine cyclodeaminase/alanine dehydrogenase-like protein (mu-crystallin family)
MSDSIRILGSSDIDKLLELASTTRAVLDSQSLIFQAYSQSNSDINSDSNTDTHPSPIQAPLRNTLTTRDVTTLIMPALASGLGGIGIKVVSVPNVGDGGLPATTTIFDSTTGKLRAVINARALTALRNACGESLSRDLTYDREWTILTPLLSSSSCPPPPPPLILKGSVLFLQSTLTSSNYPSHLLLFGSGAQIRSHAILIHSHFPTISRITLIGRSETPRLFALREELRSRLGNGVTVQAGTGESLPVREILRAADVVVTATPSTSPLFPPEWIPEGTGTEPNPSTKSFILIGSYKPHMIELPVPLIDRVIRSGGKIVVDSLQACLAEAGELQNVRAGDCLELGKILGGRGRSGSGQVQVQIRGGGLSVYKSVGIAVQDVAVAHTMILAAEDNGVGTVIDHYD